MKSIMSRFNILALSLLTLWFAGTSCQRDENVLDTELTTEELNFAKLEAEITTDFEDVEEVSAEALELTDESSMGRIFEKNGDLLTSCATITHDKENKTITVDFGEGCVGPDGKFRSGRIIVTYTARRYVPGAVTTTTLDNYTVDGKAVAGTRTVTNVSENFRDNISLNTRLEGGSITWPDGSTATREFDFTRTWVRAANPVMDEFRIEGAASGSTRNGTTYSVEILSTLIYKRKCRRAGVHIPVQGLKLIERSDKPSLLIDYGDGECDTLITVTRDGQSRVIDVSER